MIIDVMYCIAPSDIPFRPGAGHRKTVAFDMRKKYNETVEKIIDMENKKEIFVIRPSKDLRLKRIEKDIDKLQAMYDLGISDCKKCLEDLKEYIGE